jgi:signal peptidase I
MTGDYTTLLAAALGLAAAILIVDAAAFRPKRIAPRAGEVIPEPLLVSYARSFFPVILLVLIFRAFLFEPFRIPSASMMPGLVDGDFILVNKFAYGLRVPVLNTKFLNIGAPQRGDVIVFHAPAEPGTDLIKRLVGLPGDHVVVRANRVFINGVSIPLRPDGAYSGGFGFTGSPLALERFDKTEHVVMFAAERFAADFDGIVPQGHYFFMGDNRNDSEDSRFEKVGFVAQDKLIGHAIRIWMNWRIPGWPEWRRVGMRIQ